jgi:2-ketocyclohexanecarboxyl-CoA hydrolase
VKLFYGTEESKEGVRAFKEKRKPEFRKYEK